MYLLCKRLLLIAILNSLFVFSVHAGQLTSVQQEFAKLEASADGKLGIAAVDTANNASIQYRANEHFPMGCTSKIIGVAAILKQSMTDKNLLQQKITYTKQDLAAWSPVTWKHVNDGMTIDQLCAAAITVSDNTAMNLLIKELGGLQNINTFARSIGDNAFRLDDVWPKEAKSGPNDLTNSTTPAAMEKSLQQLALGDVLGSSQRELLLTWLKGNLVGNARIRAGVPKGWVVADKTGTGFHYGVTNDVGIIWPTKGEPIVVAIYFVGNQKDAEKRDDVVAEATRIILKAFAQKNQA